VDCLNADAGSNIWTAKLGRVIYDSSFAADKSRLYIGSVDGDLHCLEASTGVEKWTFRLGDGHLLASPATNGDDTVYIASMDDTVYALKTH
jgi:outer membrane protein assembly factor BamB